MASTSTELRLPPAEHVVEKFWQFTLIGLSLGAVLGLLLSVVSGNFYVAIGVGCVGLIVGVVLGIIHRKDA